MAFGIAFSQIPLGVLSSADTKKLPFVVKATEYAISIADPNHRETLRNDIYFANKIAFLFQFGTFIAFQLNDGKAHHIIQRLRGAATVLIGLKEAFDGERLKGALLVARGVAFLAGFGGYFLFQDLAITGIREFRAYKEGTSVWPKLSKPYN